MGIFLRSCLFQLFEFLDWWYSVAPLWNEGGKSRTSKQNIRVFKFFHWRSWSCVWCTNCEMIMHLLRSKWNCSEAFVQHWVEQEVRVYRIVAKLSSAFLRTEGSVFSPQQKHRCVQNACKPARSWQTAKTVIATVVAPRSVWGSRCRAALLKLNFLRRYHVHSKLVSFMTPADRSSWSHESRNQLVRSVFGKVPDVNDTEELGDIRII